MSERREPEIDIGATRDEAKRRWKQEQITRGGILDTIAQTVPWWVIIIGTGLAALSAGHTAGVFNQLSPVGYLGPFVVEFTLLWAAFSRVVSADEQSRLSKPLRILEALAFTMALIANGVGALDRISAMGGIASLSAATILQQFGGLPIITQAGIVIIPLFALFIPVGTWVAGESIAGLLVRGRKAGERMEAQWAEVERGVLYRAFFEAYVQKGLKPNDAKRQAGLVATGFMQHGQRVALSSDSAVTPGDKPLTKREEARRLLAENPDWHALPLRELEARTGIDHNTWSIAKSTNGNGKHEV